MADKVLEEIRPKGRTWMFFCPGCQFHHAVTAPPWRLTGTKERPTIRASVLVKHGRDFKLVCHSFVTDGRIQFLKDSTHELAGQTVELPDFD